MRRPERPLNMNHYANKKSAAESMLDVALLMANASQLKAVLEQGPEFTFYAPLISLISISLILQIVVGVLLIFIGTFGFSVRASLWPNHVNPLLTLLKLARCDNSTISTVNLHKHSIERQYKDIILHFHRFL